MVKNFIACLLIGLSIVLYPAKSLSGGNKYIPSELVTPDNAVNALIWRLKKDYSVDDEMYRLIPRMFNKVGRKTTSQEFKEDYNKCKAGRDPLEVTNERRAMLREDGRPLYFTFSRMLVIKALCQDKSLSEVSAPFD